MERRPSYEKPQRETTYQREINSNQFTDILHTLTIPTGGAYFDFSQENTSPPKNPYTKNTHAFIEWYPQSGFFLAEVRKYPPNERPFSLPQKHTTEIKKDVIKEAYPQITIDLYEKKFRPGRGFKEFQQDILPAITDAGYTMESSAIILRDKGLIGSLDLATLKFKDNQMSLTMDSFLGSKRFNDQLKTWWNHLT
jgi:hypothetical protein